MTNATDLKHYILEKPLKNGSRNIFLLIFAFFSTLPSPETIKVIDQIFFNELAIKNWSMNMHFNPVTFL